MSDNGVQLKPSISLGRSVNARFCLSRSRLESETAILHGSVFVLPVIYDE
jgi:hypothetical protein